MLEVAVQYLQLRDHGSMDAISIGCSAVMSAENSTELPGKFGVSVSLAILSGTILMGVHFSRGDTETTETKLS